MTRMTSFLRLFVNKVSNFHLFVLCIVLYCICCILVWLVASGAEPREIENECPSPFGGRRALQCHSPALSFFFPYCSHICAICPFIALYSSLILLQQRLLESFIWARNEMPCLVSSLFDLFGAQTSQEPLCAIYVHSLLHVPPFLLYAMILFSFLIHFVSDPWVSVDCRSFVTAFCSWFDIPSFLVIPLFNSLYDVCIVCYTFIIYLTIFFDVYCMLFQSICCMHNLPTRCTLHLAGHL
jgi:hypothetical protein